MGGREGGREGELNGYILISFVHPQMLSSVTFRCSRRVVLGLVSFRERSGIVPHASVCKYFRAETRGVNLPRNADTCATNQCLPRAAEATHAHTSSCNCFGQRLARNTRYFVSFHTYSDVLKYIVLKETLGTNRSLKKNFLNFIPLVREYICYLL